MKCVPILNDAGHTQLQSQATGTNYSTFPDIKCHQLTIVNDTGTKLWVRQDGVDPPLPIPDGQSYPFFGIANANELSFKRADSSNTQVTIVARWEK